MTTQTTTFTIAQAIAYTIEDMQAMSATALTELHSTLKASKQKAATRKADLAKGILNAKSKDGEIATTEQPVLDLTPEDAPVQVVAENSVKAPAKKSKFKAKVKPVKEVAAPEVDEEEETEETEEQAPASLTAPKEDKPDLSKMTAEELVAYVQELEEKHQTFPSVVKGSKVSYSRTEFESIEDIQSHLVEQPFTLFAFVDEKHDSLTQFLVLFASAEVVILLDRNHDKNSVLNLKTKDISEGVITFNKRKFQFSFYARDAK